jgi:hypothetical protein
MFASATAEHSTPIQALSRMDFWPSGSVYLSNTLDCGVVFSSNTADSHWLILDFKWWVMKSFMTQHYSCYTFKLFMLNDSQNNKKVKFMHLLFKVRYLQHGMYQYRLCHFIPSTELNSGIYCTYLGIWWDWSQDLIGYMTNKNCRKFKSVFLVSAEC